MKQKTRLVHAGEPRLEGAVSMPVFQSSTYAYRGEETSYDDLRYIRLNNTPNHVAVQQKLAAIDGAEAGLVASSGMAAITTTLMTLLEPGDHVLVQQGLYGGTYTFIRDQFRRFGVDWTAVDPTAPDTWSDALRLETVAMYMETLANPTLEVARVAEAARFCRRHSVLSIVDNTFATPINFRPIEHGIDIVVQSASKYLNGHSDLVAGAITSSADQIEAIRHELNHWGGTLDPHACFMLQRGLKTLALRVAQQNATADALAHALSDHPGVRRVNYPTLSSHPQHDYAMEHFAGCGGVLSFELAEGLDPAAFISRLELAVFAPSLGGPETLIVIPATSSHAGLTPEEREAVGISDGLVRVSVGIEATEDVVDDFLTALDG